MSMTIIDNFSLKGKSFMDGRQSVATVAALKAVPETDVPDGFRAYCAETKRWYEYNSANTVHSLFGRWRLVDEHANESADAKIKEAVTDKLGQPSGIAPIGENGLIDSRFIPGSYDDVIELNGIVSGVEAQAVDNTMSGDLAKCTKLYYDNVNKIIVGSFADGTYHYWAADEEDDESDVAAQYRRYMLPGGTPLKGKIYVDTSTNRQYRWGGSSMVELGKQMALGAVEGTGNVITEIDVEDNVIKPKKSKTFIEESVANGRYASQTEVNGLRQDLSDVEASVTIQFHDTNTNVSTNTAAVTALATRVSSLEAAEPDGIPVSEIEALFA